MMWAFESFAQAVSQIFGVVAWISAGLTVVGCGYWILTTRYIAEWRRAASAVAPSSSPSPPVTFLRPLKAGVSGLGKELAEFLRQVRPEDQAIFGVEPDSHEERVCAGLKNIGACEIRVVGCARGTALNPKISKLIQMTALARHDHLIVMDAEFSATPGWLDRFRDEWAASSSAAATAGYVFSGANSLAQRLDALSTLTTLWPGLSILQRHAQGRLMLGAVMALRREALVSVGGWETLRDHLADDNQLGAALVAAGHRLELSREVATLRADEIGWRGFWDHQRRVAVTYRVCNPLGFLGLVSVQGVSFALLALVLRPGFLTALLFVLVLAIRLWSLRRISKLLGSETRINPLAVIVSSIIETACWLLAWLRPAVTWSGRRYRIQGGGKLEPAP
jgi:ceramide glucosyltransferase